MIRVFVGSSEKFMPHEKYILNSIRRNSPGPVEVTFLRPKDLGIPEMGCTGFTNIRFAVPNAAGHQGFAIYLDVDMIVLADIAELYAHAVAGKWCCMVDGSTEVMVIDCGARANLPDLKGISAGHKSHLAQQVPFLRCIPAEWNCEDCNPDHRKRENKKLIHFTDLKCQPYFGENPWKEGVEILEQYK